ncbi:MAG: DUF547 domain-containing protein [Gammaproteobacteria bacterium]|nr:DUF547 domain-containing protein [Gammaproteobacteria bacterium]
MLFYSLVFCALNSAPIMAAEIASNRVDHALWQQFLDEYVVTHPDGINRVRYAKVTAADKKHLQQYLQQLQNMRVSKLTRDEQLAYWINLYNALTVNVILQHYPTDSIRNINISGWFSTGPWKKELIKVENKNLSLNDIEHRILRIQWQDNRIHYALNCASLGCPNLNPQAFTSTNLQDLLNNSAKNYINHSRGVTIKNNRLIISTIYKWYAEDFGGNDAAIIAQLQRYASPALKLKLQKFNKIDGYAYNWQLNDVFDFVPKP